MRIPKRIAGWMLRCTKCFTALGLDLFGERDIDWGVDPDGWAVARSIGPMRWHIRWRWS